MLFWYFPLVRTQIYNTDITSILSDSLLNSSISYLAMDCNSLKFIDEKIEQDRQADLVKNMDNLTPQEN